jgi:DNA polymerase III epsilon subunit family exonuclease
VVRTAVGQSPQGLLWLSLAWWAGAWGAALAVAVLWWGTLAPPLRAQLQEVARGGGLMALALVLFTLPLFVWAVQLAQQRRSQWRSQTLREALRQSQAKAADLERHVAEATSSLRRDRHVLAALVAELTQGVLVCHGSGEIMLYNRAARQLLQPPTNGASGQRWLGIGRSVHALLDPVLLAQATGFLQRAQQRGQTGVHMAWLESTQLGQPVMLRATLAKASEATDEAQMVLVLEPWPDQTLALSRGQASMAGPVTAAEWVATVQPWLQQVAGVALAVDPAPDRTLSVAPLLWAQQAWATVQAHACQPREPATWRWSWQIHDATVRVQWWAGDALIYQADLPLSNPGDGARQEPARGDALTADDERPEFFDFDWFETPPRFDASLDVPLSRLTYTVFDLETTGLNPSDGDEIIEIGAVRVVNQRVRRAETLHQLIAPKGRISASSQAVHGLTPAMLAGQPPLPAVMPGFHGFAEGTVLVAHNAAFDMRFLELSQAETGLHFDQPVLDTLLLSAVVHPEQGSHRLDAIAQRFGLPVFDRHHALGDALLTAEVWLRLMPLLHEKGIVTLAQALDASRQTWHARLRY